MCISNFHLKAEINLAATNSDLKLDVRVVQDMESHISRNGIAVAGDCVVLCNKTLNLSSVSGTSWNTSCVCVCVSMFLMTEEEVYWVWETYWSVRRSWRRRRRCRPAPVHSWWGWCRRPAGFPPGRRDCSEESPRTLGTRPGCSRVSKHWRVTGTNTKNTLTHGNRKQEARAYSFTIREMTSNKKLIYIPVVQQFQAPTNLHHTDCSQLIGCRDLVNTFPPRRMCPRRYQSLGKVRASSSINQTRRALPHEDPGVRTGPTGIIRGVSLSLLLSETLR